MKVYIDTRWYRERTGKSPRGKRAWVFSPINPPRVTYPPRLVAASTPIQVHATYTDAAKEATRIALERGVPQLELQP